MLPSKGKDQYGQTAPNYITIIPRTREWGAFLGSATYAMEKMLSDSPDDFGKFSATMAPMLSPIAEVPVPQVIAELVEQGANWDFYNSQNIVPTWQKNLPNKEQTNDWVSPTVEAVANLTGQSPLRVQHATQGLLGGAGQAILSIPDYISNLLSGKEQKKGIPIVSPVIKRFYPERGGQLYKNEQESIASKKADEPKALYDIEDKVWQQYSPQVKTISDEIIKLENSKNRNDNVKARQILMQHPEILMARRIIAQQKALHKRQQLLQQKTTSIK
jgi:hypothetical protein